MITPAPLTPPEYRALVEQSPLLIWRAGTDALCDYFNQRWLEFRGKSMEEEVGDGWTKGVHAEDFDRCVAYYLENFNVRRPFEMEYRLQRHDGVYRWIFDRGVPSFSETGEFVGYIGSCFDVTERTEAQAALKAAQEAEIGALKSLLPMCSWCKKIRDDAGYWNQVEIYIRDHLGAAVSHGICPGCTNTHFADDPA